MPDSARSISCFARFDTAANDMRDRVWEHRLLCPGTADKVQLRPCLPPDVITDRVLSEKDLVSKVLAGDQKAGQWFVQKFERFVYAIIDGLPIPFQEQHDVCQHVFLSLWEHDCRRLRLWEARGKGRLASYLSVIVRRTAYTWMRRHLRTGEGSAEKASGRAGVRAVHCSDAARAQPETAPANPMLSINTEDLVIAREQKRAIRHAVTTLLHRDSEIIRRRYFRGESYAEIAKAMGMTVNNVGVALNRAQKRIHEKLRCRNPGLFD